MPLSPFITETQPGSWDVTSIEGSLAQPRPLAVNYETIENGVRLTNAECIEKGSSFGLGEMMLSAPYRGTNLLMSNRMFNVDVPTPPVLPPQTIM